MILRFLFLFVWCISAQALDAHINKKYPFTVITNDYGILNEDDLAQYSAYRQKKVPFTGSAEEFSKRYWQCFPRQNISISFIDTGHPYEGDIVEDTLSDLTVTVYMRPGVIHEYGMRKPMPSDEFDARFQLWRKLLRNEPFVCLGGEFVGHKEKIGEHGSKQELYTWTFDKIKTKKGCDSYFDLCK